MATPPPAEAGGGYHDDLSDMPMYQAAPSQEELDAAYRRHIRKLAEDKMRELESEGRKHGRSSDELRKKILNRKNVEYEKLYE